MGHQKRGNLRFCHFFEESNGNVLIWIDLSVAYRLGSHLMTLTFKVKVKGHYNAKCSFCAEFRYLSRFWTEFHQIWFVSWKR